MSNRLFNVLVGLAMIMVLVGIYYFFTWPMIPYKTHETWSKYQCSTGESIGIKYSAVYKIPIWHVSSPVVDYYKLDILPDVFSDAMGKEVKKVSYQDLLNNQKRDDLVKNIKLSIFLDGRLSQCEAFGRIFEFNRFVLQQQVDITLPHKRDVAYNLKKSSQEHRKE